MRTPAVAMAETAQSPEQRRGILFGPERTGLDNDEVALADEILTFPANPAYASLNLAQAVLLVGYEWFKSSHGDAPPPQQVPRPVSPPADRKVASIAPSADRQVAEVAPLPVPRPAEAKRSGASVRDMAQRAKAAVMAAVAPPEKPTLFERLFGKSASHGSMLAYASADASSTASLGPTQNPALGGSTPLYDRETAVYDISAHMVYLPDGTKLEAHSGLGDKLDDPRSANVRMRGVTPPHLYDLRPREALFHGVPALRLNPIGGEDAIYGRSGLLAHTYMLGPNGDSNGCVSFKNYEAFLQAYRNGEIKRLAVVARLD